VMFRSCFNLQQYEHIIKLHGTVVAELPNLITTLDLCELPKDVKDAEKLMQEDLKLKETIVGKIAEAEVAIDIASCLVEVSHLVKDIKNNSSILCAAEDPNISLTSAS